MSEDANRSRWIISVIFSTIITHMVESHQQVQCIRTSAVSHPASHWFLLNLQNKKVTDSNIIAVCHDRKIFVEYLKYLLNI